MTTKKKTAPTIPTSAPHPLVGRFFHTFHPESRLVEWQGEILAVCNDGVLVQLFDWIIGQESCQKWCPLSAVAQWDLYDSAEWI